MKNIFPEFSEDSTATIRFTEVGQAAFEKSLFSRHPNREWGTFFRFGFRKTKWGLSVTVVDFLFPTPGELDRKSSIVSFHPDYISRVLDELDSGPLAIGVAHSHPHDWGVIPSPSDDDMDVYYARLFEPYGIRPRPYASIIINRDTKGQFVFSGRVYYEGKWMPLISYFVHGEELNNFSSCPSLCIEERAKEDPLSRWESLIGPQIRSRVKNAAIGVVGCSGTGSPAVEIFARAQVGEFILVDDQRISPSNLERIHGSRLDDIISPTPPYKVEVMARLIKEINPEAKITKLVGNVLDDLVIDELLRCDLILGCTDTLHSRVQLGDLASLYYVPSIDVGVLLKAKPGKVISQHVDITKNSSAEPCPYCRGRIPAGDLNIELMSDEEKKRSQEAAEKAKERGQDGTIYWAGEAPQFPTVGHLTTFAGSMAAGYALNWMLGTATMPHSRMQFDLCAPYLAFIEDDLKKNSDCSCARFRGFGDLGERSIIMPSHFPSAILLP